MQGQSPSLQSQQVRGRDEDSPAETQACAPQQWPCTKGEAVLRITSLFISAMKQENRMWFSKTKTERHPNNSSERNATEPSLKASKSPIRSSAARVHHLPAGRVSELWRPGRPTRLWLLSSMARTAQCSKENASEVIQKLPSSTEIPETVRGREL